MLASPSFDDSSAQHNETLSIYNMADEDKEKAEKVAAAKKRVSKTYQACRSYDSCAIVPASWWECACLFGAYLLWT
jgi:hypothetical protein